MKNELQKYIWELQSENNLIAKQLNTNLDQYSHTVKVHTYNTNLEVIKRLEKIMTL